MKLDRAIWGASTLLAVVALAAGFRWPPHYWLTPDQQADRLVASDAYLEAAATYEDPLRQGVAYFQGGEFESAAAAFARLDAPDAAYNRGNALVMLGKYDNAIQSYDRALQLREGWKEATDNRAIAMARKEAMKPPEDDAGGTGGELAADEIVFDDRAKNASQTEEVEVGTGEQLSDTELRELWLQRVQTKPADFLRAKFAYQLSRRNTDAAADNTTATDRNE